MTSSYCAFPISKVLGLIAAINPTMTAGIPGVRGTKKRLDSVSRLLYSSHALRRVHR